MACYQLCSPYYCGDNEDDEYDVCDPCDCYDVCPSVFYIQPKLCQYVNTKSQALANPVAKTIYNQNQMQSTAQASTLTCGDTSNGKNDLESEKFCIYVNVNGFDQGSIEIRVENGKLILEANREDLRNDGDYNVQQFRKTYQLPKQADPTRITSHIASGNILVIGMPICNSQETDSLSRVENNKNSSSSSSMDQSKESLDSYIKLLMSGDFHPRIIDQGNNRKLLEMTIDVKQCQPEEINVSVKNDELIVQGEHKIKEKHHSKRSRLFRSTTLPAGAQVNQMTTKLTDDGQLQIEVPLLMK
ncbi:hypothetical protein I4U23_004591 [Adineta vaga]|nr:hypothetical protein I4U23_004591 [Adineta vaga]